MIFKSQKQLCMKLAKIAGFAIPFSFFFTFVAQDSLQKTLVNFLSTPSFRTASVSLLVLDNQNGDTVLSYRPELSLPTASTAKLFSTSVALQILGPSYRPKTDIIVDGDLDSNGNLQGNIWVKGGGDPTLGSRYFHAMGHEKDFLERWVDTLYKLGIRNINGNIQCDGSSFGYDGIPDGWNWGDMGNYYGAGPSGLCVYDNMLKFYFRTPVEVGKPAVFIKTVPEQKDLVFEHEIRSANVSGDNSYIYGSPYSNLRWGKGTLPVNQYSFEVKGSLPDPEQQLGEDLKKMLESKGIRVIGTVKTARKNQVYVKQIKQPKILYSHAGPTIQEIVNITNQKSINLFAEQLVCLLGYEKSGKGTTEAGLAIMDRYLQQHMNCMGLFLQDGSGLSRSNGISAGHLCSLLQFMSTSQHRSAFQNSLPISGKNGTLTNLCKGQPCLGKVTAKSGTMSRIKSYAGYIQTLSGKKLTFAIVLNNFNCSSWEAVNRMEMLFNRLLLL
jgi:D-alanyl-D-alanine carboxypeptidase/D-alanyl-D-alanine-endopeptidase (penicillin-binding protein 4)